MVGTIYISGEIGVDTTLLDVIKQVKNQSAAESFLVKIDSVGGAVDTGMDIYYYLKNLSVPVTTYTIQSYSIASVIFMAGSTRIIPEGAEKALMIHLPFIMGEIKADQSLLSEYQKELKNTEDNLVKFYSEALEIDTTTIHSLLKSETYLNATQAKDLGFATLLQVAQKAVARLHNNKEEKEEKSLMEKLNKQFDIVNKQLDNLLKKLSGKPAIKAELILQDATGLELVFPDLEASDAPAVDATVTVDGQPAEGEFLMIDESTIVIAKGVVTEIKPKEVVEEDAPSDEQAPAEPAAKAEMIKSIAKYEMEVINTSFELGEILKYVYEEVEYNTGAGEYELPDGRRVVTDADGVIVEVKEASAPAEEQAPVEELPVENNSEELDKMIQVIEMMSVKNSELETKFQALAKSIGSDFTTTTVEKTSSTIKSKEDQKQGFSIKRK